MLCTICDREFKSYGALATHAAKAHGLSIEECYIKFRLGGVKPTCSYSGCENSTYFKGSTRGFATMCSVHRGKWQEGLTIADPRIKARGEKISQAFQEGAKHWSDDESLREVTVKKISDARKASKKPRVPGPYDHLSKGKQWALGLTKDSDPRLMRVSESLRITVEDAQTRFEKASTLLVPVNINEFKNVKAPINVACVTCGLIQKRSLEYVEKGAGCDSCHPQSRPQRDLRLFIESCGFATEQTRSVIPPLELDVWIKEKKFAIEHNGLYWHSEATGHEKNKHQLKTDACYAKGIDLMHVFEDEVNDKREILESMIKHKLGLTKNVKDARKLKISEISSNDAREFFNKNHLDGSSNAKITFALLDDKEIVIALSLRKPFVGNHDHGSIEICRLATRLNTSVRGGLSRLLSHVRVWAKKNGYNRIITYADQRWGKTHAYCKHGFSLKGETGLRFWWVSSDFSTRYGRLTYQATDDKSEADVAKEAGVTKIWGCKNSIYEMML